MPPGFRGGEAVNNICNQQVARIPPHPTADCEGRQSMGWDTGGSGLGADVPSQPFKIKSINKWLTGVGSSG
jgi:hypothetical protein